MKNHKNRLRKSNVPESLSRCQKTVEAYAARDFTHVTLMRESLRLSGDLRVFTPEWILVRAQLIDLYYRQLRHSFHVHRTVSTLNVSQEFVERYLNEPKWRGPRVNRFFKKTVSLCSPPYARICAREILIGILRKSTR